MFSAYRNLIRTISAQSSQKNDLKDPTVHTKRIRAFIELQEKYTFDFNYIHITGTSGKGTVATYLHTMLYYAGHTVGLFTSPHCITTIERIQVNSLYISPADFVSIYKKYVSPILCRSDFVALYGTASFFEICLCIALVFFAQKKCTHVVLEAGIGGLYDATNFIQHPILSVITSIGYDHTELLGNTLTAIARDKGGIIKPDGVFVTSEHRKYLLLIFKNICKRNNTQFFSLGHKVPLIDRNGELVRVISNILNISGVVFEKAISKSRVPCRLEEISKKPCVVLDGAHNPSKISFSISLLKKRMKKKNIIVIFASACDKDVVPTIHSLMSISTIIIFTELHTVPSRRFYSSEDFRGIIRERFRHFEKRGGKCLYTKNPQNALSRAQSIARDTDCIFVTGSFYLAGELRKNFYSENYILSHRKSF